MKMTQRDLSPAQVGSIAHAVAERWVSEGIVPSIGDEVTILPSEHAVLGASSASRWLACPESLLAPKSEDKPFSGPVNEEMLDCVGRYVDFAGQFDEVKVEQTVRWSDDVWGTADLIGTDWAGTFFHIVDLKYGFRPVSAVRNAQLMIYALGVMREVEEGAGLLHDDFPFLLTIFQPRTGGEDASTWHTTAGELRAWEANVLKPGVLAARETLRTGSGPVCPSAESCRYCGRRATCRAVRATINTVTKGAFDAVPVAGKVPALPAPTEMTPDELARALDFADCLTGWVEAVQKEAFEQLQRGLPVPGRKLVRTKGHRAWVDEQSAAAMVTALGVEPYAQKLRSPAQVEKDALRGLRGDERAAVKEALDKLVDTPYGVTMAAESDKRPAITDAGDAFALI